MAFSPNLFLSNIKGKDGLARPCRFEVVLPIPLLNDPVTIKLPVIIALPVKGNEDAFAT